MLGLSPHPPTERRTQLVSELQLEDSGTWCTATRILYAELGLVFFHACTLGSLETATVNKQ